MIRQAHIWNFNFKFNRLVTQFCKRKKKKSIVKDLGGMGKNSPPYEPPNKSLRLPLVDVYPDWGGARITTLKFTTHALNIKEVKKK